MGRKISISIVSSRKIIQSVPLLKIYHGGANISNYGACTAQNYWYDKQVPVKGRSMGCEMAFSIESNKKLNRVSLYRQIIAVVQIPVLTVHVQRIIIDIMIKNR
jgi:hypothetical protein